MRLWMEAVVMAVSVVVVTMVDIFVGNCQVTLLSTANDVAVVDVVRTHAGVQSTWGSWHQASRLIRGLQRMVVGAKLVAVLILLFVMQTSTPPWAISDLQLPVFAGHIKH